MPILTSEERIGTILADKYKIVRVLGEGGMGVVFEGTHEFTRRRVAVKLLHAQFAKNESMVQRFLREARAAAALKHRNVVDVLDMGREADGSVYLVLEFLTGEALSARMDREGKFAPETAAQWLLPIMGALKIAHARGIVHRDIKPENIFLARDEDTGEEVPKLLDFGIAKIDDGGARATSTGQAIGTPAYMAPEQATNASDVDAQADIWSLGVLWFEALSGRLPYRADSPLQMLGQLLSQDPMKLTVAAPDVPTPLALAVERALERDRSKRWPSLDPFMDAIRQCFPEIASRASVADGTGSFRAVERQETLIEPASPSASDARAMMATMDAGAVDARAMSTMPARPANTPAATAKSPATSEKSTARTHETLSGVEQQPARARPAWIVPAAAAALAVLVGAVGLTAMGRAPGAQPAAASSNDGPRAAEVPPARRTAEPTVTPPVATNSVTVTDAGAVTATTTPAGTTTAASRSATAEPSQRAAANNGAARVRGTTPARTTATTAATSTTTTTTANNGSATNAGGSRVRVMNW